VICKNKAPENQKGRKKVQLYYSPRGKKEKKFKNGAFKGTEMGGQTTKNLTKKTTKEQGTGAAPTRNPKEKKGESQSFAITRGKRQEKKKKGESPHWNCGREEKKKKRSLLETRA